MSEGNRFPGGEVTHSKKIHVYSNGDQYFSGKSIVINPRQIRNYDALLEQTTKILAPPFGAVRCLRTPDAGTVIHGLNELEAGKSYVACSKKFKKLGYTEIRDPPVKHPPPPDLLSPRERKRIVVSGRVKKIRREPVALNVYTNGEPLKAARRVLIQPWIHKTWEVILELISSKVPLRSGALRQLVHYPDRMKVSSGVELVSEDFYVAVGSERYKDMEYGLNPVVIFSPQQQQARKYPSLAPIKGRSTGQSGSTTNSEKSFKSSAASDQSIDSNPKPKKSRPRQVNGHASPKEEEGIPVKPIKHKRTPAEPEDKPPRRTEKPKPREPEKKAEQKKPPKKEEKEVDLDVDESGKYKSKTEKQKADEISDDTETKKEVPVEKLEAEEVEDEPEQLTPRPSTDKTLTPRDQATEEKSASPAPSKETRRAETPHAEAPRDETQRDDTTEDKEAEGGLSQDEAATRIQAGFRGYKTRRELMDSKDIEAALEDKPAEEKPQTPQTTETKNTEEDDEQLKRDEAATKIQANYRGYRTRKELAAKPADSNPAPTEEKHDEMAPKETEEPASTDNKDDEEARNAAATKIQANYRGYATRKMLKAKNQSENSATDLEKDGGNEGATEEKTDDKTEDKTEGKEDDGAKPAGDAETAAAKS